MTKFDDHIDAINYNQLYKITDMHLGVTTNQVAPTATQVKMLQETTKKLYDTLLKQIIHGMYFQYTCKDCGAPYTAYYSDPPRSLTVTHCLACEEIQKAAGGI